MPDSPPKPRPRGRSQPQLDLAIGVGCLWFAIDDPKLKSEEYYKRLSDLLSSIESITNLRTKGANGKYGGLIDLSEDEQINFLPHVYYAVMEFKVFIPQKVQERLEAVCNTEQFNVTIFHHYHMPVTYVSGPASDFPLGNPSRAVVLVKRYLAEKLSEKSEFTFDCTGPSPFHADFITSRTIQPDKLIDLTTDPGYKKYIFGFNEAEDLGLLQFYERYGDTFSLFYYLEQLRSKVLDAERKIVDTTNALLAESQSNGWFSRIRGSVLSGRLIDDINEGSLEDQLYRSYIASAFDEAEKAEPTDRFHDLAYHFNELRRFGTPRQNSVVKDIVETSEKRRQGFFQNITVLIAGLAGGILGAILGSALTYSLTSERASTAIETRSARPIVDLSGGMKLLPSNSTSGYCIFVPPRRSASGSPVIPRASASLPACSQRQLR